MAIEQLMHMVDGIELTIRAQSPAGRQFPIRNLNSGVHRALWTTYPTLR